MPTLSYREYLDVLKGPSHKKRLFKTVFIASFAVIFLTIGTLSALLFYYKKNVEPQITASNFIQNTSVGFVSSKQSLTDVLETFQVAGEKVAILDNLQNSQSAQAGYFVDLSDKQKLLEKIKIAKQNIEFQRKQLQKSSTPQNFQNITNALIGYYDQSENLLTQTEENHQFFKDMLLALGPDFYLPVLSDESIWKSQDPDKIKSYYDDKKLKAQDALTNIAKLTPDENFRDYYNDELAYLELLVKMSSDVTATLTEKQEQKPDEALPVEKAYQKLTNAKQENNKISQKLLLEKERLLKLNENLNKFAAVRYQANAIQSRLEDASAAYQTQNSYLPKLIQKIQARFLTS